MFSINKRNMVLQSGWNGLLITFVTFTFNFKLWKEVKQKWSLLQTDWPVLFVI